MNDQIDTCGMFKQANEYTKDTSLDRLQYAVGALLYTPASHKSIANDVISGRYPQLRSLALCLEDSIADGSETQAEQTLLRSLQTIYQALDSGRMEHATLPLIFVRVRDAAQLKSLCGRMGKTMEVLTGIIVPKFSKRNALQYQEAFSSAAQGRRNFYLMPVLESGSVLNLATRASTLQRIKEYTDQMRGSILNIRVGGNDFCGQFGFRRGPHQTIYDCGVVANALYDIVNVFAGDYVVSGPVWEYFGTEHQDEWIPGLRRELSLDKLNGFVGKTAIHPTQLATIQQALSVSYGDYLDAKQILNWNNKVLGVQKSECRFRMNEVKVHRRWAQKILALADLYGVQAEGNTYEAIGK